MAKRPRMGRNLNALLGSSARERVSDSAQVQEPEQKSTDEDPAQTLSSQEADAVATLADDNQSSVSSARLVATPDETSESSPTSDTNLELGEQSRIAAGDQLVMLAVEKIQRGTYQPRRLFDQELLQELADSIKTEGMIQPIIVRPLADDFELVAGERRWRAAQLAGMEQIPAIIRSMEDKSVAAVSVIENIQRKDLNPLEEAAAFERLCDEFGMTHKAVAEAVGRSRASVSNLMRLLELHDEVKAMVDKGQLEMGHARALLGAPARVQPDIARRIIKQAMTVRAVENYVRSLDADGNEIPASANTNAADPDIERLSKKLSDKLGAQVKIKHKGNGSGNLQITYTSVSELQGILEHIK